MVRNGIDAARLERAIREAERETSGKIRVSVAPLFWGDVRSVAEKAFERFGMHRLRDRNAVLFLAVPSRRKFVVLGGSGIHQKVGQEAWDSIAREMSERRRATDLMGALEHGIREVGTHLALHFAPREQGDDELLTEGDFVASGSL